MKKENVPLHPLPVRIWHWLNAVLVFLLIFTGIELRFTDIRIFSNYGFVVALHKYAGYLLALSFLFWIAAYRLTGGLTSHYLVSVRDIQDRKSVV